MQKISNTAELKATIRELELRTQRQESVLKSDARDTAKSFKPANLLKSGVRQLRNTTPDMKTTAINTFIGLAAGAITRKLVIGRHPNILRRTLGAVVQAGITRFIYKKLPAWQMKVAQFQANKRTLTPRAKVQSARQIPGGSMSSPLSSPISGTTSGIMGGTTGGTISGATSGTTGGTTSGTTL